MVWDYHLINIQVVLPKNHPFQFCHNFSMYLRWWSGKLGLNVGGQEWKRCLALLLQTTSCLGKLISEPYATRWPNFSGGTEVRGDICLWWKDGKTAGYLGGLHPTSLDGEIFDGHPYKPHRSVWKDVFLWGTSQQQVNGVFDVDQPFWRPSVPAVAVRGTVPWRLQEFTSRMRCILVYISIPL